MGNYHPEPYWSEVAKKIGSRKGNNIIAGDDEPFYRYKRQRFLQLLHSFKFTNKDVLEIGHGPGGNLVEVWAQKPKSLTGIDISADMIALATKNVSEKINLVKINGSTIPFEDNYFNVAFTATVLQHNTDEVMLKSLIEEICRVTNQNVILFERIEPIVKGDELCYGRPVSYYEKIFNNNGFVLESSEFINIQISYLVCGAIRKLFNPKTRKEGDPLTKTALYLQNITLPITKILDRIFVSKRDLGKLVFRKTINEHN
jgi:ubiquinone/menaquinone biosynthesis C-methylase UbiE